MKQGQRSDLKSRAKIDRHFRFGVPLSLSGREARRPYVGKGFSETERPPFLEAPFLNSERAIRSLNYEMAR
jgi:hypothetical protein